MAFRTYLTIKGKQQGQFKGESKKEARKDKWAECLSVEMESVVAADADDASPKGFRKHKPLVIIKEEGVSSPQILQSHWRNEILDEVVFEKTGRSDDGKKEIVTERITLKEAVIVGVRRYTENPTHDTREHDLNHLEAVSFRFRHIMVENVVGGTSTSDDWNQPDAG